ncbi:hypothetical protein YC2023_054720 [Brassica napus]
MEKEISLEDQYNTKREIISTLSYATSSKIILQPEHFFLPRQMDFGLRCGIYVWDSVQTEVSRIYASASSSSPIQSVKSSDRSPSLQTKPCSSPSLSPSTPLFSPSPSTAFSFGGTRLRCLRRLVTSCVASVQITVANGSAQLLLLWRDSRFATVFLSRDAWPPTPLIFSRYGKDSVVWLDSDPNSDTDTDSEKDDENEARRYLSRGKNSQSLSLISSLKLILWLPAFLNACLPLIPKTVHLLKMYLFALSDPYFSGLSNSEREPSTQPISKLEFDFERKKLTNDDVRELIYREILEYHPQMLEEYKHGGDQLSFMYPSADQNSKTDEYITFKIVGDVAVAADRRRKQGVEMVFDDHNRDESLPVGVQ